MKTSRLVFEAFLDLLLQVIPIIKSRKRSQYAYAFLVHPRDFSDIYRKYPFLRTLPEFFIKRFALAFWPVVVSRITGLKNRETNEEVPGYVITIAMTAEQMLENRELALRRIRQAVRLASKKGARIIGLGALTSSVSRGGLDVVNSGFDIAVTTGHAYTALNITEYVSALQRRLNILKKSLKIAIIGAAGSVGSTCAKLLARDGYTDLLLIDVQRKHDRFIKLPDELKKVNQGVQSITSHTIDDVRNADFIITATNAPEAVVRSKHVQPGTFIIDDAQPSDIADDVFDREDVVVLEAGAVHTPGITANFNMGLLGKYDNFCCMAEVLILASKYWDKHYVIDRATLELVDEISKEGDNLGFTLGRFQNDRGFISNEKLNQVEGIIRERYSHVR